MKRAAALSLALAMVVARADLASAAAAPAPKAAAAPSAPSSTPPALTTPTPPPPYEPQLIRLAELMGALAYLRDLCGQGDSAEFRAKMAALLAVEPNDAQRRDQLAGAYNRSFQDYATSYRACGPSAAAIIERDLAETARLTSDLANRYGG